MFVHLLFLCGVPRHFSFPNRPRDRRRRRRRLCPTNRSMERRKQSSPIVPCPLVAAIRTDTANDNGDALVIFVDRTDRHERWRTFHATDAKSTSVITKNVGSSMDALNVFRTCDTSEIKNIIWICKKYYLKI